MKTTIRFFSVIFILLWANAAFAQTTAFNYQGKLTDANSPQAAYQMQFKLFDAAAGGTQIGSTIENPSVAVEQGVFAVKLDFGANVFTGADRFLEIAVRRSAGESYTVLTPRQQIASSPYSIRTISAQTADLALDSNKLGGINASEYVTNSTVGSSFIRNGTTLQTGNFNISGNGLIGGSVGIGTNPSAYRLDVLGYIRSLNNASTGIAAETTGEQNAWARFYMRSLNLNGTINQGWMMGTSRDFNSNQFYLADETGGQSRMTIQPNGGAISFPFGNVGIGTSNPNTRLTLNGGVPWTSNGWTASMNLQNASALGWEANASGQRFGIGQSGGGLYFFRTNSAFGTTGTPANYDLVITDNGNLTQPSSGYGLPKAMVHVDRDGTLLHCYNGLTGASTPATCGFTSVRLQTGIYRITLGFATADRFIVGSLGDISGGTVLYSYPSSANDVTIEAKAGTTHFDAKAYVIVY